MAIILNNLMYWKLNDLQSYVVTIITMTHSPFFLSTLLFFYEFITSVLQEKRLQTTLYLILREWV